MRSPLFAKRFIPGPVANKPVRALARPKWPRPSTWLRLGPTQTRRACASYKESSRGLRSSPRPLEL
eukprot:12282177-Alexandrium_andersonii.AAC.1